MFKTDFTEMFGIEHPIVCGADDGGSAPPS